MPDLAIVRGGRGSASTIGDIPILSTIVNDVEASARAALYQQLADFQAIPQRSNRVLQQINAFAMAAPTRSAGESSTLAALQTGVSTLQGQWSGTNNAVNQAIAELTSGGANPMTIAADVAKAVGGMTLAAQAIGVLEQQARSLVSSSSSLSDAQRSAILAAGAPFAFDLFTVLKWGAIGYVSYRVLQSLSSSSRRR